MKRSALIASALIALSTSLCFTACSSGPEVRQEKYAKLSNQRTFEYDFATVWRGIEDTVRNYHVTDRDPKDVDANEMRRIRHRTLTTDWIYTKSNDKFVEYKVNGLPRKTYLQTRISYKIDAQSVIGGVTVTVKTKEEVERLNEDGSPSGWDSAEDRDTSRASDLLDRINMAILSAGPSNSL